MDKLGLYVYFLIGWGLVRLVLIGKGSFVIFYLRWNGRDKCGEKVILIVVRGGVEGIKKMEGL